MRNEYFRQDIVEVASLAVQLSGLVRSADTD